ncbi:MAG: signal peptide prediction [Rubrivivax sp.]|nr:signal peptide prediction [Rubrivivax sp.]
MILLRHLWPLPWTLLGLLLGLIGWALGGRWRVRAGTLECVGGRLGRLAARSPFAALTLGHVILAVSAAEADRLGAHERSHVRQYEAWGPFFVPAYLLAGAWAWLCGGCAHADNPFERAAVQP